MSDNPDKLLANQFRELMRRYTGSTPEAFIDVLCPMLISILTIDKEIKKFSGQNHYRASFSVQITEQNKGILCRGCTGKFVPGIFASGGTWREIAKGRIIEVAAATSTAFGEIYTGGSRADLEKALSELSLDDLLEVDQYGAAAKVLSGLAEHSLVKRLADRGLHGQKDA